MRTRRLYELSRAPGFAAKGIVMMPDGAIPHPSTIVVVNGRARQRLTGQEISAGMVAEFDADETWDLEILEDMTYWHFTVRSGPPA
jgi:hypothetical protein